MGEIYSREELSALRKAATEVENSPRVVQLAEGEDMARPTWAQLVRHQPQLGLLLNSFDEFTDNDGDVSPVNVWHTHWGGGFKYRMKELVGRYAETKDPFLRTSAAYDVAYDEFRKVLHKRQEQWNRMREQRGQEDHGF